MTDTEEEKDPLLAQWIDVSEIENRSDTARVRNEAKRRHLATRDMNRASVKDLSEGYPRMDAISVNFPEACIFELLGVTKNVPYGLDYFEVTHNLLNVLTLMYNKFYGSAMVGLIQDFDKYVMSRIVEPLSQELKHIS